MCVAGSRGGKGGPPVHRSIGPSVHRSIGPSVHRSIGPSVHRAKSHATSYVTTMASHLVEPPAVDPAAATITGARASRVASSLIGSEILKIAADVRALAA